MNDDDEQMMQDDPNHDHDVMETYDLRIILFEQATNEAHQCKTTNTQEVKSYHLLYSCRRTIIV